MKYFITETFFFLFVFQKAEIEMIVTEKHFSTPFKRKFAVIDSLIC